MRDYSPQRSGACTDDLRRSARLIINGLAVCHCMVEVEDMKLEMAFNGSYHGERDKLMLVNRLIADGILAGTKYHEIDLHEIQPETQESFFDYIFEDIDVFDRAREKAQSVFTLYLTEKKKVPAA